MGKATTKAESADGTDAVLSARDVTRHFPVMRKGRRLTVRALDDVNLEIGAGEVLGLVGESGCGKSTFSRIATMIDAPTSGTIEIDGINPATADRQRSRELRAKVQMVFQDPNSSLDPRMSVGASIAEPMKLAGTFRERGGKDAVLQLLGEVGLGMVDPRRHPRDLSGGQKQRVAIARALSISPRLLVLDEPVSALDVSVQAQIVNLFDDLKERLGLSYLFVTHDLAVVRHISDVVAVMYLGQIVEKGPAAQVFSAPRHPYTRALLDAAPEPNLRGKPVSVPLSGEVPSPLRVPSGCRFSNRCPLRAALGNPEICTTSNPDLAVVAPGQEARCHFSEQMVSAAPTAAAGARA